MRKMTGTLLVAGLALLVPQAGAAQMPGGATLADLGFMGLLEG